MKSILPNILGKEFHCINKIIKKLPTEGIGDDCAVLGFGGKNLLVSVDTFSDHVHFERSVFSLQEIGERCAEASISDIAAMGGKPLYMLVSVATPDHRLMSGIPEGIKKSLKRHNTVLVGGDTTYSKILSISITVLGTAKKPVYRSGANVGDAVYITGHTGLVAAGLCVVPKARVKEGLTVAKYATAIIDISDGLASELYHIAFQSNVSIEINSIPINKRLERFCKKHRSSAENFALYGGEDYELLITGPAAKFSKIKGLIKIGAVIRSKEKNKVYINKNKKRILLDPLKGFKHF